MESVERHLLQSQAWETVEQAEGRKTFWRDGDGYAVLAVLHHTPLGNYLFCPYGPTLTGKDTLKSLDYALGALSSLAREQSAFFVRIEPTVQIADEEMKARKLVKSHDIEPAHTWVLDLTQSQEELLDGIEKTKVRHWRNHEKKGLKIYTTQDAEKVSILTSLLAGVGKRDNFTPQDEQHLANQLKAGFATLYVAEFEGQPIAASLVYDDNGVRYYAHAATDDEHRKMMAGTVLLVQMILDAKDAGAKTFDFWGITTTEDHNHPWYGFTQYKKSFGGKQVDYAGTWDLPVKPWKYRFYKILRKLNRAKRKVQR